MLASLLACGAGAAAAGTATVPDDFPTIQEALDFVAQSVDLDTVLVRSGSYPETPLVRFPVVLIGISGGPTATLPLLAGLTMQSVDATGGPLLVRGFRFEGPVNVWNANGQIPQVGFADCIFDAGVSDLSSEPSTQELLLRRCRIKGLAFLTQRGHNVVDSCVVEGWVLTSQPDTRLSVTNSVFLGDGTGTAIRTQGEAVGSATITGCSFDGYENAIGLGAEFDAHLADNRIRDCRGFGIRLHGFDAQVRVTGNLVERCGYGIDVSFRHLLMANNDVSHSGGDGISVRADGPASIRENVVSFSGGDGLRISGECDAWEVRNNTSSLNTGSGFVSECQGIVPSTGRYEFVGNIGHGNGGYGVRWVTPEVSLVSCNDWFGNASGAVEGRPLSGNDLLLDPQFCDPANGDFTLRADSPLLDAPGCGRIGALGQGCEPGPIAMEFDFTPNTLNLASRGRWVTSFLEPAAPRAASHIEKRSIRLNETVPADLSGPSAIGDHDDDGIPDLMVKFDREAVQRTLEPGEAVEVTVTGTLDGLAFAGTDTIRVLGHGAPGDDDRKALAMRTAPPGGLATGRIEVEFTLPEAMPARLEVLDVAGRVKASVQVGELGAGQHALVLPSAGTLRQGIYFLRLRQGTSEVRRRAVVIQ